jgi:hypothetical protein
MTEGTKEAALPPRSPFSARSEILDAPALLPYPLYRLERACPRFVILSATANLHIE